MDIHIIDGCRTIEMQINNFGLVFVLDNVAIVRTTLQRALEFFDFLGF